MKNNFGLSKHFYWSLPRSIRNKIKDETDAGFAIYNHFKLHSASEFRKKVRARGWKNVKLFVRDQMPRSQA